MPNQTNQRPSPLDLLNDPGRVTVSISQAAMILGIAKSTASASYRATGFLMDGVPVLRIGKRCVVSVHHLRTALGMPEPDAIPSQGYVNSLDADSRVTARPTIGIEPITASDER